MKVPIDALRRAIETEGLSYSEAACRFSTSKGTIQRYVKTYGIISPKIKGWGIQRELARLGLRQCSVCKKNKPLTNNNFRIKKKGYPDSICRPCWRIVNNKYAASTLDRRMRTAWQSAKSRAAQKKVVFKISEDFLMDLWKRQGGCCAYTGEKMTIERNQLTTVSVDRVDPQLGYVEGNIVLCCAVVNRMKQNLPLAVIKDWCRKMLR